jgi:hypothetical protein
MKKPGVPEKSGEAKQPVAVSAGNGLDRCKQEEDLEER